MVPEALPLNAPPPSVTVSQTVCPVCSRREETFYTTGRRDALVALTLTDYGDRGAVVTAEDERLSSAMFKQALTQEFPGVRFRIEHDPGCWRAVSSQEERK